MTGREIRVTLGRGWRFSVPIVLLGSAMTSEASAHVKWFAGPVDLGVAPHPIAGVVTIGFMVRLAAFMALVSAGGFVDAWLERRRARPRRPLAFEAAQTRVVRVASSAYLLCLAGGLVNAAWATPRANAILAPELLLPPTPGIAVLQLLAALLVPWRRIGGALAAAGMIALYGIGIRAYGLFHMVDYLYFVGIATYLIASDAHFEGRTAIPALRYGVLRASLGLSLMWTAVEKFLYPQWVELVLRSCPAMSFGLPAPFVIPTAGFVEFSLSFYLLFGRSLLRLDALVLLAVSLSAIPMFGRVDEVGHIPIVAILLVIVLHGPDPRRRRDGVRIEPGRFAGTLAALYAGSLAALTLAYYGMQRAG